MDEMMSLEQVIRKAFQLGQIYWQQADSESWKQNDKSLETKAKFDDLLASYLATPAQMVDVDAIRAAIDTLRTKRNTGLRDVADILAAALPKEST